jgi:hypothetical protein
MASKVSNFSDLIQRVAASCHDSSQNRHGDEEDENETESESEESEEQAKDEEDKEKYRVWWEGTKEEVRRERIIPGSR